MFFAAAGAMFTPGNICLRAEMLGVVVEGAVGTEAAGIGVEAFAPLLLLLEEEDDEEEEEELLLAAIVASAVTTIAGACTGTAAATGTGAGVPSLPLPVLVAPSAGMPWR
jgi:hypothetical protein